MLIYLYPSHKWDGNELKLIGVRPTKFIAVGFSRRKEMNDKLGFSHI